MSLRDRLRTGPGVTRSSAALLVGVVAFALTIAAVLLVAQGAYGPAETADGRVPYAGFEFSTSNVTVHGENGTANLTGVSIAYRSGVDLPQRNVAVRVNGEPAWNVVGSDGSQVTAAPWNATDLHISAAPARVVVYGMGNPNESVTTWGANETYSPIESGDVVDVVWYGEGDEMTVLQRYTVGDTDGETPSGNESA